LISELFTYNLSPSGYSRFGSIYPIGAVVLDLLTLRYSANEDNALEVLVLQQQTRILDRRVGKPVRPSRAEKLLLALTAVHITERVREGRKRLNDSILLFKPATVLKWHRGLVKRKWTFQQRAKVGRLRIKAELEAVIVRLATENPGLGFEKLRGELLKLGYDVGISTVRDVLARHHIPQAPERDRTRSHWRTFLNHYRTKMLACDFFTIETVVLKTIYVLFSLTWAHGGYTWSAVPVIPTRLWSPNRPDS